MTYLNRMNDYRSKVGYYTIEELCDSICPENIVFDVTSVLISKNVRLGTGNILYPGVILETDESSGVTVGNHNIFRNNTRISAQNGGQVSIGDANEFGDGPVCVVCNRKDAVIRFAGHGRYDGRINIYGNCDFGTGSQLLGTINVYNCTLMEGGDFTEADPEKRAGLLKGVGTAKGLKVERGMVINGFGTFTSESAEPQLNYHKPAAK